MELYLFLQYVAIAVLVIGGLDSIRIGYKVLFKYGAFENFIFSHIMGTIFAGLRILPYVIVVLALLFFSDYFKVQK